MSAVAKTSLSTEFLSDDLLTDIGGISASATVSTALEIKAKSVVLMEPHTGKVLYETNPDERLAPASITKIMSLLLVMEAIENEKLTLTTKVSGSEHAASMGGSQIWLEVGEQMTVDELLRASVIASANDATVALAEAVSG
ncbi:MAG: D-alanyl-D-alanine carboxypeptidase, partial [Clostridia bacterium]|nr:D-alanyl-D-alanine carboxypeptidase [Clostridia bacterium]